MFSYLWVLLNWKEYDWQFSFRLWTKWNSFCIVNPRINVFFFSDSFQTERNMIVLTVFLSIVNRTEFRLVHAWSNENCHYDHIPFTLKRIRNMFPLLLIANPFLCLQFVRFRLTPPTPGIEPGARMTCAISSMSSVWASNPRHSTTHCA